jgi:hypothetical protein
VQRHRWQAPARAAIIGGMTPFSVLDLSPIVEGASAADALRNSLALARTPKPWTIGASGWRSITTCPASPRRPPQW